MHREATKDVSLVGKHVLVVGGTAGIGEGAAITFARHGASVTIVGRNTEKGAIIVQQMRDVCPPASPARFEFKKLDLTSMAEIKQFAKEYTEAHAEEALDILIITAGVLRWGPREETHEGIEKNFAVNYVGRFLIIKLLIPLLQRSENATVISILRCGQPGEIDFNDVQLKNSDWGARAKMQSSRTNALANDLMIQEFGNRYPNIHFFHVFPGWVNTDLLAPSGLPLNFLWRFYAWWFGVTPEAYSHTLVHICTSPEYKSLTGCGLDEKGNVVPKTEFQKQPDVCEKLWNYTLEITGSN
eukprot:Phypoly_transcript_13671.p1 GENE.Phypoly_transcript_13671~~Phypoly_transcript_13671.p1  ORF type:complete len:299 (+),score=39.99 Phypoly_transcript_13671:88-984(+)